MSMFIVILISDESKNDGHYVCTDRFDLDSWCTWFYKSLPSGARKPPDAAVKADWHRDDSRIRPIELLKELDIEMVEARHLKGIKFHEDDWHPTRIAHSKAASEALCELPDDRRCFVYLT